MDGYNRGDWFPELRIYVRSSKLSDGSRAWFLMLKKPDSFGRESTVYIDLNAFSKKEAVASAYMVAEAIAGVSVEDVKVYE